MTMLFDDTNDTSYIYADHTIINNYNEAYHVIDVVPYFEFVSRCNEMMRFKALRLVTLPAVQQIRQHIMAETVCFPVVKSYSCSIKPSRSYADKTPKIYTKTGDKGTGY